MQLNNIISRSEQWLVIDWPLLLLLVEPEIRRQAPELGAHAHDVFRWLIQTKLFPEKWIKRIFSIGGIRWKEQHLLLLAYSQGEFTEEVHFVDARSLPPDTDMEAKMLYEDDFCFVLSKPVRMPVHKSSDSQIRTLDTMAALYSLRSEHPFPVRHIHRLDGDTTGVVLYSKNDWAQLRLDEAMREGQIERHYIAAVHGQLSTMEGEINKPIAKDRFVAGKRRVAAHGDPSITLYRVLQVKSSYSIVALQLLTGRTHQIRVHMSAIGHPLLGDILYGGKQMKGISHQALHAYKLIFPHPVLGNQIIVEADPPDWLEKNEIN
ncbi:RluA family pseudouridine synthase [Paenibacillus yanchengensis]|uniref:Pseudouridine synthase n=1 Tax=Paenibacillus yanchengensis TaxID=2035833 RepID=A0ABW4YLY7_9BACL